MVLLTFMHIFAANDYNYNMQGVCRAPQKSAHNAWVVPISALNDWYFISSLVSNATDIISLSVRNILQQCERGKAATEMLHWELQQLYRVQVLRIKQNRRLRTCKGIYQRAYIHFAPKFRLATPKTIKTVLYCQLFRNCSCQCLWI